MILYETNRNWWNDFREFRKSYTMQRIARFAGLYGLMVGILAICDFFFAEVIPEQPMDVTVFSLLGIVLSILLVFRTNSAYDRWWEGRIHWGALVNHSRNLSVMGATCFPEDARRERHELAVGIANFSLSLKEHLRKGAVLDELIGLDPESRRRYAEAEHLPATLSLELHRLVERVYRQGDMTGEDVLNFKPHLQALLDICGACERIRKTPIPFSYSIYLRFFILAYSLILPLVLVPLYGFWSVPIGVLIFFAFAGIQLMAEEIEDPFGLDCNDLPTGDIAKTIGRNAFELLGVALDEPAAPKTHEVYEKVF
ncbi:hypothetical protein GC167_03210 [bacterium]|nr:hypothetical protein [bacterium]